MRHTFRGVLARHPNAAAILSMLATFALMSSTAAIGAMFF